MTDHEALEALSKSVDRGEMPSFDTVSAVVTPLRTGQLIPAPSVETVADRIEEAMGPVFGSPEYLADPVKLARAEKRRRDGAMVYARAAISAMQVKP